jgi:hypothetical protein
MTAVAGAWVVLEGGGGAGGGGGVVAMAGLDSVAGGGADDGDGDGDDALLHAPSAATAIKVQQVLCMHGEIA